jgi:hypothetical protein
MDRIKHDIELQIADWRAKATLHCSNSLDPRVKPVRTPVIKALSLPDLQLRMFIASRSTQSIVYYGSIAFIQYPDGGDRWFVYRNKTYVDCMSDLTHLSPRKFSKFLRALKIASDDQLRDGFWRDGHLRCFLTKTRWI